MGDASPALSTAKTFPPTMSSQFFITEKPTFPYQSLSLDNLQMTLHPHSTLLDDRQLQTWVEVTRATIQENVMLEGGGDISNINLTIMVDDLRVLHDEDFDDALNNFKIANGQDNQQYQSLQISFGITLQFASSRNNWFLASLVAGGFLTWPQQRDYLFLLEVFSSKTIRSTSLKLKVGGMAVAQSMNIPDWFQSTEPQQNSNEEGERNFFLIFVIGGVVLGVCMIAVVVGAFIFIKKKDQVIQFFAELRNGVEDLSPAVFNRRDEETGNDGTSGPTTENITLTIDKSGRSRDFRVKESQPVVGVDEGVSTIGDPSMGASTLPPDNDDGVSSLGDPSGLFNTNENNNGSLAQNHQYGIGDDGSVSTLGNSVISNDLYPNYDSTYGAAEEAGQRM